MDSSSTEKTAISEHPKVERKDDTEHSENTKTVESFAKTEPVISPAKRKPELTVKDETKRRRGTECTKDYDENIANQKNVKDAVLTIEHSEKSQTLLPSAIEIHEMEDNADKDRGIVTEASSSILQDAVLTDVNTTKSEPHILSAKQFFDNTKESKKEQGIIQTSQTANKEADIQITSKPDLKINILQTESAHLCLSDESTLSKSNLSNKLFLKNISTSSTCDRVDSSDLKREEIVNQCNTEEKFTCKSKRTESRSVIVENPNKEKARIIDMRTKNHETDTKGHSKSQEYNESFQKYEKRLLSGSQIISPVKRKSDLTSIDEIKRRRNNLGEKCGTKSLTKTLNISDTVLSLEIFGDTSETAIPLAESVKEETFEKPVEMAKHVDESTSKESRQSKNKTSTPPSMSRNCAQFEGLAARFMISERKPVSLNKSLHSDTFNQSEGSHSKERCPEYPDVIPTNDIPNSSPKVIVEMIGQKSKLNTAKNETDSNSSDNKTENTKMHDTPFSTMSQLFTSVISKEFLENCRKSSLETKKPEDLDISTSFQEKALPSQENYPHSTFTENTKKHFPAKPNELFRSIINREMLKTSQSTSLESTESSDKKPEDPDFSESFREKVLPLQENHPHSTHPNEESCSRTLPISSAHTARNHHLHPLYLEQDSKFVPVEQYENDPEIIESQKRILASFERQSAAKQKENLEPKRGLINDFQLKKHILEKVCGSRDTLDIFLENYALILMLFRLKSDPEAYENSTKLEKLTEIIYAKFWNFLCLAAESVRKWGMHGNNASPTEFRENGEFPEPMPTDEENLSNSLADIYENDPEMIETQKQILASFEQQSKAKQKENLEPKKKEPERGPINDFQLKRHIRERVGRSLDTLDIFLENHALILILFLLKSHPEAFENSTDLERLIQKTYSKLWEYLCLAAKVVRKWGMLGNNASPAELRKNEEFPGPMPTYEESNPPNSLTDIHRNNSQTSLTPENENTDIPDLFLLDDVPPLLSPIPNEADQTTEMDYPKYKEYPGLAEEPAKVKKDARYQKKFYKQKPVKLPVNWTVGNSSTECDFDVNSESNDPRILRKFGNRKDDEKTGEVDDGRSPIYDLRTLSEDHHTNKDAESHNNDVPKTLQYADGYKVSSFMEESPTSPTGSSKSNKSDHPENKDSPPE